MKNQNRGVVLVMTLLILTLLFVLCFYFMQISSAETSHIRAKRLGAQALSVAESGMQYALYLLKDDADWTNNPNPLVVDKQINSVAGKSPFTSLFTVELENITVQTADVKVTASVNNSAATRVIKQHVERR